MSRRAAGPYLDPCETDTASEPNRYAAAAMTECVELPRPLHLLRVAGWNAAESFGLPVGGYAIAPWLAGPEAGLWALLAAIWFAAGAASS